MKSAARNEPRRPAATRVGSGSARGEGRWNLACHDFTARGSVIRRTGLSTTLRPEAQRIGVELHQTALTASTGTEALGYQTPGNRRQRTRA